MQIGMIGLGRMGGNIVRRLMKAGHHCVVFDRQRQGRARRWRRMARPAADRWRIWCKRSDKPRAVWVMLPAGAITEETVDAARQACWSRTTSSSTAAIPSTKTISAAPRQLAEKGIHYVDCGTSGGVWGIERGYCMMIGGAEGGRRPPRSDLRGARARARRHPAHARTATRAIRAPSAAISTPARPAPGISSRWCITASSTA